MNNKLICKTCTHHLRNHKYANPKSLSKKEKNTGLIPWLCQVKECECIEFLPSEGGE
jgi:hypothetical protein